jgi:hypothetical protein
MNVEEFRLRSRATLEATLNQLQAAMLLVTELEAQITDAGRTVQQLTQVVEEFINTQPPEVPFETPPYEPEEGEDSIDSSNR